MKFVIDEDEYYPFRTLETPDKHNVKFYKEVTIPDDNVEWINATMMEFKKVQAYLEYIQEKE